MSKKREKPISILKGVEVKVASNMVTVKGPKGQLCQEYLKGVIVKIENDEVLVSYEAEKAHLMPFQGLYRTLIANMIEGVVTLFIKKLEMKGVGYRASMQEGKLNLLVGKSHPTLLPVPAGLHVEVEKNTFISVSGADKQKVGQFAAFIREQRPPEPYQGKGIRYADEHVRRKAGKTSK
jgi:large subunit ribosomal protein L6